MCTIALCYIISPLTTSLLLVKYRTHSVYILHTPSIYRIQFMLAEYFVIAPNPRNRPQERQCYPPSND